MPNTNAQTIHQMGSAINSVVRQATGRDAVGNIDMDFVTVAQNKSIKAITTDPGAIASFVVSSPVVLAKLKAQITPMQTGSGVPSPDNIRPIKGVNPLVVNITGINQWDEEWELGAYNQSTGSAIGSSNTIRSKNRISVIGGVSYCVRSSTYTFWYDADDNFIEYIFSPASSSGYSVITAPVNARYLRFYRYGTTYANDIIINYPSTDTEYHAYTGRTQSISFSPTPGTVYGGELEVDENGDGVLTVTWKYVELSELQWNKNSPNTQYYAYLPSIGIQSIIGEHIMCNKYKSANAYGALIDKSICIYGGDGFRIWVFDSDYDTLADFIESLTGTYIAYELETPETYQISTTPITTISGENNIFTGTGNLEVTYYEYGEVI